MKITKSQVLQIIKEEAQKVKQEIILRRELAAIEKELQDLNEVHAGGPMDPGKDGVHAGQKKAVFTKKGSHLIEDEDIENDETSGDDVTADVEDLGADMEMPADDGMEAGAEIETIGDDEGGTISIEDVRAAVEKLGADLGLTGQVDFDAISAEDAGMDIDGDELGVDIETGADDVSGAEMSMDTEEVPADDISADIESGEGEEEEVDELRAVASEQKVEECGDVMSAENDGMAENKRLNEEVARWKVIAGIVKG